MRASRRHIPLIVLVVGAVLALTALTRRGWLVLLTDGLLASVVVAAAGGWGAWPTVWLGLGRRPLGQQICLSAALGLGVLSAATLVLGVRGALSGPVAWAMLSGGGAAGLARVYRAQRAAEGRARPGRSGAAGVRTAAGGAAQGLVLLPLAGALAVGLFAALLPPGVLWADEARGYDVLEYHLQAPREYFEAGRVEFLPHNVYASFPQQMEMLYLLLMHLAGGPRRAAIAAQLLHLFCGILAVAALGCWAPSGWGRTVVLLVAGTTPWLAYTGCLAYVECGMLLFAAVAAGLVADQCLASAGGARAGQGKLTRAEAPAGDLGRERGRGPADGRRALAAGLCAGLAGGCKYTAMALVAAGLGVALVCALGGGLARRLRAGGVYAAGVLLALSPWLVRNVGFTGNPVYPFAYGWFGGAAWSAEQAAQWERGHRLRAGDATVAGRARVATRELLGVDLRRDDRGSLAAGLRGTLFGPLLVLLALAGLMASRSRVALVLTVWGALILLPWLALTHMPGRFAMPLIVPAALLAGEAFRRGAARGGVRPALVVLAFAGALMNVAVLAGRLRSEARRWRRLGVPLEQLVGATEAWAAQANWVNRVTPADAYVWLVGEARAFYIDRRVHYTVVFNRDPWLEYARRGATPAECVAWLRSRNVTHVVFSWAEIHRLRSTYGFPELVSRAWAGQLAAAGLRPLRRERGPAGAVLGELCRVGGRAGR